MHHKGEHARIIKLDATDSTNDFLKGLAAVESLGDFTTVVAREQLQGRGQRGSVWESEAGKNLTFSLLKYFNGLKVEQRFVLNIAVSLALCEQLEALSIPNVKVKWPNDIMSGPHKICGILIENVLKGQMIQHSVIGIGLNVNQTGFGELPRAGSLASVGGRFFDLEELLLELLGRLQAHLVVVEQRTLAQLLPAYEARLFRKDLPTAFAGADGGRFMGLIRGVSPEGTLILELEDGIRRSFDLKQVSLLY